MLHKLLQCNDDDDGGSDDDDDGEIVVTSTCQLYIIYYRAYTRHCIL